jgi:type IV pilus assembly protein PilY1
LIETQNNERKGERVVQAPQLRGDRVIYVSLIPDTNPCKGGGSSWINAVAYTSGAALDETPFDFDLNGVIDSGDLLAVSDSPLPVPGTSIRLLDGGIYSGPAALPLPGGGTKTLVSSSEGELIELRESSALRWRVWQQIQ